MGGIFKIPAIEMYLSIHSYGQDLDAVIDCRGLHYCASSIELRYLKRPFGVENTKKL